jgi:hypothetical protein
MTAPNGSYPEIDALPARLRQQVKDDHARGCQGREYGCDCGYDLSTEGLLEMAADEIDRLRDTVDIPPERHRTDEQRKDIQRAWDIVGMVTDGHPLNSTEGHLAVLRGIQMGRQLSGVAQEAQQPPQQAIDFNGSYPDTAQALWEALCEQCAATKDKSQVKALVMVRREDVAAVFSGVAQAETEPLREALEFYADPETYHAIAILGDRPCGEFADDMSVDFWTKNCGYDRPMPGKRAREALALPSTMLCTRDLEGWEKVGDGTPLNAWLETKLYGEEGHSESFCRLMSIGDEPEWIARDGRTTVTHHSYAAPTHWRWPKVAQERETS